MLCPFRAKRMGNQEPGIKNEKPVIGRAAPSGLSDNRAVVRGAILSLTGSLFLIPGSRFSILFRMAAGCFGKLSSAASISSQALSVQWLVYDTPRASDSETRIVVEVGSNALELGLYSL